jgi:hypothetical protein
MYLIPPCEDRPLLKSVKLTRFLKPNGISVKWLGISASFHEVFACFSF